MRILFITATRIGDAVLSTGLLDHLIRTHPTARITVACGPAAVGVFARMPNRERTVVIDKRRYDLHWWTVWRTVVRTRWDLVVDLRGSALAFLLLSRRRAVMRGGRRKGHRLTHLAGALDLASTPAPVAWTGPEDRALAASLMPGRLYVGLGPTANWSGKVWPGERFVALFRDLQRSWPDAIPVVFAGPGQMEAALAEPVLAGLPDALDLSGRLSLPEAAACLARCVLFIGNDSGLMHLAAAAGTPTLGLFGPTPASEYAPRGYRTATVMADGPPGLAPIDQLDVGVAAAAARALMA